MGTKRPRPRAKARKEIAGLPGYLLLLVLLLLWLFQELRPGKPAKSPSGNGRGRGLLHAGGRGKGQGPPPSLMDGAQESLEGAFYEFRDLGIAQGLLRAKGRGVKVRLYGESDHRQDFRRYLVAARLGQTQEPPRVPQAALREGVRPLSLDCEEIAGIPVCYDEREGFMHHKFLVADGKFLWTGSTNMTWNAFARNNENSLLLPSPTLAQGYAREFQALFGGKKEGLGLPVAFRLEDPPSRGWPTSAPREGKGRGKPS